MHPKKCFLGQIFGTLFIAEHMPQKDMNPGMVSSDNFPEGVVIALANPNHQRNIRVPNGEDGAGVPGFRQNPPPKPRLIKPPLEWPAPPLCEVARRRHQYPPLCASEPSRKHPFVEAFPETKQWNLLRAFARVGPLPD